MPCSIKRQTVPFTRHEAQIQHLENEVQRTEQMLAQIIAHGDVIGHGEFPVANIAADRGISFTPTKHQPSVFLLLAVPAAWFDRLAAWASDREDLEDGFDQEQDNSDREAAIEDAVEYDAAQVKQEHAYRLKLAVRREARRAA